MDAVKFLKTKNRMCKTKVLCKNCPLDAYKSECDTIDVEDFKLIKIVSIIEQWDKENPAKTYKDDFLEKFPKAVIAENICRYHVYKTGGCDGFTGDCELCWNEPIEE